MRVRLLDGVLIVLVIAGAVDSVGKRAELSKLELELARVQRLVGNMVVTDKSLCHIQAIPTDDPWQWAWRVYLPDRSRGLLKHTSGGGSGSHGFDTFEQMQIARCSIAPTRAGSVGIYFRFAGGSSFSSFGTPEFFEFLKENRQRLELIQLGSEHTAQIKAADAPKTIFRLRMSDALAEEARLRFPDPNLRWMIPDLTEVTLDLQ